MEAVAFNDCAYSNQNSNLDDRDLSRSPNHSEDKNFLSSVFTLSSHLISVKGGAQVGDFLRVDESIGSLTSGQILTEMNGYCLLGCTLADANFILSNFDKVRITIIDQTSIISDITSFLGREFHSSSHFCYLQTILRSNLYFRTTAYTTRKRRSDSTRDFNFVSNKEFLKLINDGALLEWGFYNGIYYGTPMPAAGRCFLQLDDKSGEVTNIEAESAFGSVSSENVADSFDTIRTSFNSALNISPRNFISKREICDYFWWCHSFVVGAEEFEIVELDNVDASCITSSGFGLYGIGKCSILVVDKPKFPLIQNDIVVSVNSNSLLWLKDNKILGLFNGYKKLSTVSLVIVRGFSFVNSISGMDLPLGWKCSSRGLYEDSILSIKTRKRPTSFVASKSDVVDYFAKRREKRITSEFTLVLVDLPTEKFPISIMKLDERRQSLSIVEKIKRECSVEIGDILIGIGGRSLLESDDIHKILNFVQKFNQTVSFQFVRGLAYMLRISIPMSISLTSAKDFCVKRRDSSQPFGISICSSRYGKFPKLVSDKFPTNTQIVAINGIFVLNLPVKLISAYIKDFGGLELHLITTIYDDVSDSCTTSSKLSAKSISCGLRSSKSSYAGDENAVTNEDLTHHFLESRNTNIKSCQYSILERFVTKGSNGLGIRVSSCDAFSSSRSLLLVHECFGRVDRDIKPGDILLAIGSRSLLFMSFSESLKLIRSLKQSVPTSIQLVRGLTHLIRNPIQCDGPYRVCNICRSTVSDPFGLGLSYTQNQTHPIISRLEADSPAARCSAVRLGLSVVAINDVGLAGLPEGVLRAIFESISDLSLSLTIGFSGKTSKSSFSSDSVIDVQLEVSNYRPGLTFRDLGIHLVVPPKSEYPAIAYVEGSLVAADSFLRHSLAFLVAINGRTVDGIPFVPSSSLNLSFVVHQFRMDSLDSSPCQSFFVHRHSHNVPFGITLIGGPYSYPSIVNVKNSSPAHQCGVSCGLQVLAIDGVDCSSMSKYDVAFKLRGGGSTTLYLLVTGTGDKPSVSSSCQTDVTLNGDDDRTLDSDLSRTNYGLVLKGGRQSAPHIIRYVIHDSKAARCSMKVGDEVVEVDGVDVSKLCRSECNKLLSTASSVRVRSSFSAPLVDGDV